MNDLQGISSNITFNFGESNTAEESGIVRSRAAQTSETINQTKTPLYCKSRHNLEPSAVSSEPTLNAAEDPVTKVLESIGPLLERLTEALLSAMDRLSGGGTTSANPTAVSNEPSATPMPFQQKLLAKFNGQEKLSEADLQNGIVEFQLYQKSAALGEKYAEEFEKARTLGNSISDSVTTALKSLQQKGDISSDDARWVMSLSARAAQLDDNVSYVRATAAEGPNFQLRNALQIAEVNLASITNGTIQVKLLNWS